MRICGVSSSRRQGKISRSSGSEPGASSKVAPHFPHVAFAISHIWILSPTRARGGNAGAVERNRCTSVALLLQWQVPGLWMAWQWLAW